MTGAVDLKWIRARDGAFLGVCKGVARALNLQLGTLRLFWALSILLGGAGLWLYLILAIAFPPEDLLKDPYEPMAFGVCSHLARKYKFETGIVRLISIFVFLLSAGTATLGYIALYFGVVRKDRASDNKP